MSRVIACCSTMNLEPTFFKCSYFGINWNVKYCKSCQRYYIQGFGLDTESKGERIEVLKHVRFDHEKGCWVVIEGDKKGNIYADN